MIWKKKSCENDYHLRVHSFSGEKFVTYINCNIDTFSNISQYLLGLFFISLGKKKKNPFNVPESWVILATREISIAWASTVNFIPTVPFLELFHGIKIVFNLKNWKII